MSRLRTGLLWLRNEAAGQMSYPGMCRRAVDHTVYYRLFSHGPYLQTATWLLDSWLFPVITVSFLPRRPSHSFALFKPRLNLHFTPPLFFLGVHTPSVLLSGFLLSGNKMRKDELHREKIKSWPVTTEKDLLCRVLLTSEN